VNNATPPDAGSGSNVTERVPTAGNDRGQTASQISREIVRLHARLYGRGPTKARTYLHDDYALCVLEDIFTTAEKTLKGAGRTEQVVATRNAFQDAVSDQFNGIVKEATGRSVRVFVSYVNTDEELAVELFIFSPDGQPSTDGAGPEEPAAG
jgi:uncharacterized protein YbcI